MALTLAMTSSRKNCSVYCSRWMSENWTMRKPSKAGGRLRI